MQTVLIIALVLIALLLLGVVLAMRIVKQYERGVLFRFGRLVGTREPGLRVIIPVVDVLHRVSLRIVTMPIQSQGIQLRNLQSLVEIGVDKNTTVVFPAPLMTTIAELGSFLARENEAAGVTTVAEPNGTKPRPVPA